MSMIGVKPVRAGMGLRHPLGAELPNEGGFWPDDQNTARAIRDGDVKLADIPTDDAGPGPSKSPAKKD